MDLMIDPPDAYQSTNDTKTKLFVIINSKTPIIFRISSCPEGITLGKFKQITSLGISDYKFYFKSTDPEFGLVKEEVIDDNAFLPHDNNRIVAWVISGSNINSLLDTDACDKIDMNEEFESQKESIISVTLELNDNNFLGLTLMGLEDYADQAIYVGQIALDSVCHQDGRVAVGDRLIKINDRDITGMNNDDAIRLVEKYVEHRGRMDLIFLKNQKACTYLRERSTDINVYTNAQNLSAYHKCNQVNYSSHENSTPKPRAVTEDCSINSRPYMALRQRLVDTHSLPRSITPRSLYTNSNVGDFQSQQDINHRYTDSRSVYEPLTHFLARQSDIPIHCSKDDVQTVYQCLCSDAKNLDIRDREWLRMTIKETFLGSSLVKWLQRNVYGFNHKRDVKRYANRLLMEGFIKSPMASGTFSQRCYYTLC